MTATPPSTHDRIKAVLDALPADADTQLRARLLLHKFHADGLRVARLYASSGEAVARAKVEELRVDLLARLAALPPEGGAT